MSINTISIMLSKVYFKTNTRSFLRYYSRSKPDPGINLRKKVLNLDEDLDDVDFDDFEADFMSVHKTHKEHVTEMEAGLEKEKFHIVKQKYFKEKHLNFLTWHDKEQIRYLHSSDPEEWTVEKLSESFPALPEVVKKIVKSKWTINPNTNRIISHDKSVQMNWDNFKNGQIPNLPNKLVDHLNKFTNRALTLKPFQTPEHKNIIKVNLKPVGTEFSEIISSYNKLKAKKHGNSSEDTTINIKTDTIKNMDRKDYVNRYYEKSMRNKPITLHQLQYKLNNRLNSGKTLTADETVLVQTLKEPSEKVSQIEASRVDLDDITKRKYETNKTTTLVKKNQHNFNHLIYPEKITIPKNLLKRGYTYKLNDCYYDDDGLFLYRVPGMN